MCPHHHRINRRQFLHSTAAAGAAFSLSSLPGCANSGKSRGQKTPKVIVIGVDGMDPHLTDRLMRAGLMPNLANLTQNGGFRNLKTSIPPQSPVAWANFINGAGPGSHGIFDFIHRDPAQQCLPYFSASETIAGAGGLSMGEYKVPLTFWPFNHTQSETVLRRAGTPFWDYLDADGVESVFYDLPSNYPPSPSQHGHHRCLSGMGTPDMLGTYSTYQHFAEDGPVKPQNLGGGRQSWLFFEDGDTAHAELIGLTNDFLKQPKPTTIEFQVHRDRTAQTVAVDIQNHKLILKPGSWSDWLKLDFTLTLPSIMPDKPIQGICRFYLQEVTPNVRIYVTPVNIDPSEPAVQITEPPNFITDISEDLGLFYTTGFQEDHKALTHKIFTENEFITQAEMVLSERLELLDYALKNYDDGLLFFYFSSTDLQSHMLWWDDESSSHPTRSDQTTRECFDHLKNLYHRIDGVVGDIVKRYGDQATIMVMSDHGFGNFGRQFDLNLWLRENGYIRPGNCQTLMPQPASSSKNQIDWDGARAYGLGINGLYINQKGREINGIVNPGAQREELLEELIGKLKAVRDIDGTPVIREVYRSDKIYSGKHTAMAPDLIVGYHRNYRASWNTCLGDAIDGEILSDNDSAWSADHCADQMEVPGILFSNKQINTQNPALIDMAPTILAQYNQPPGPEMIGKNVIDT